MTRRDRIIRLAKLRGDRAALAIMKAEKDPARCQHCGTGDHPVCLWTTSWTETELRALWGDR